MDCVCLGGVSMSEMYKLKSVCEWTPSCVTPVLNSCVCGCSVSKNCLKLASLDVCYEISSDRDVCWCVCIC